MVDDSHVTNAPFDAYEGDEPYIFISYKHSDWKKVYPVIKRLNESGFNIWYDAALTKGKNYDIQIANHIQNSALFVTFITQTVIECANDDEDYLVKELTVANSTKRKRLPIFLDDVDLTGFYLMHYAGKQSIWKHSYGDNEDLFIGECIRAFRDDFGIEPRIQSDDARLTTVDLKLFDKLNSTTESIFDLENHEVLIILKDGTNLTSWEDVGNKDDIIYVSENLTVCSDLKGRYEFLTSLKAIVTSKISDKATDLTGMFYDCKSLVDIYGLQDWNTGGVTGMKAMFFGCSSLKNISSLKDWDTCQVTDMSEMFLGCSSLNDISALENWNVSSVTDMSKMFYGCSSLSDVSSLRNWDTGQLVKLAIMFYGCSALSDISGLKDWNTGNADDMTIMFYGCFSIDDVSGLKDWNTSRVTNMKWMFHGCSALKDIEALHDWDTGRVTDMSMMFHGCSSLSDISPLENWDVGHVTSMSKMFKGCRSLTDVGGLHYWNIHKVIDMSGMFRGCLALSDISGLKNWNCSEVILMRRMFENCSSLADLSSLSDWNVANADTEDIFENCESIGEYPPWYHGSEK